jgi:hypothetical protein
MALTRRLAKTKRLLESEAPHAIDAKIRAPLTGEERTRP